MMRLILIVLVVVLSSCGDVKRNETPSVKIKDYYSQNVILLKSQTSLMVEKAKSGNYRELRYIFNEARKYYKRTEALTEYYFPAISKAINGPAIDKLEEDDEKVIAASGFQVIEELIFPDTDSLQLESLLDECRILNSSVTRLQELVQNTRLKDENIIESIRLQLLRIISLGLSGFDSPVNQNSIAEAMASLDGIEFILLSYTPLLDETERQVSSRLTTEIYFCKKDLIRAKDFESFDRAYFISRFFNPLCHVVDEYQKALQIGNNAWPSAIDLEKKDFFQEGVFNVEFFAPHDNRSADVKVRELGKLLFFDPVLSGNNLRSCASCHKPSRAFSDSRAKSLAFGENATIYRNAPVLVNSAFQMNQFWDGRVTYLEDQISQVVSNPDEMHGNLNLAAAVLVQSDEYRQLFRDAFDVKDGQYVNEQNLQRALAAYVRSLESFNSNFDLFMRGNLDALSENEVHGFNIFMGKGKCGTCHFLPLFNGSVPPFYKETESEILGVPKTNTASMVIDSDKGKYNNFAHALFENMFKTPTVRNAALTAPYMHNGVFNSLEEVVDFYNEGGGIGSGIKLEHQTLPADKLNLTPEEKSDLIAFIQSLTDTTGLTAPPIRLPALRQQELNDRKIGGLY